MQKREGVHPPRSYALYPSLTQMQQKEPKKRPPYWVVFSLAPPVGLDLHFLPHLWEKIKVWPPFLRQEIRVRLTVAVPGGCPRRQSAFVPRRPLPLAPLPVSAPGGGRVAPYLLRNAQSVKQRSDNRRSFTANSAKKTKRNHTEWCGFFLAPLVGLEPTTCGLTVRRSTD